MSPSYAYLEYNIHRIKESSTRIAGLIDSPGKAAGCGFAAIALSVGKSLADRYRIQAIFRRMRAWQENAPYRPQGK